MASILDAFHPAVRTWFERRFGSPSRAQELGWPRIAEAQDARGQDAPGQDAPGHDVLLCAPTGSGKTLAAFMWAINRLVCDAADGALSDHVSVLYVSPLKALANDIRLNLEEPLDGVRAVAVELGLQPAPIRAGLRTGDTPASERAAMLRRPPQILVTTPESLFILLTSANFREKLRAVRYVIVDELHAIAGNKRGAHLHAHARAARAPGACAPALRVPHESGSPRRSTRSKRWPPFSPVPTSTAMTYVLRARPSYRSRRRPPASARSASHCPRSRSGFARDPSALGGNVRRARESHPRPSHNPGLHLEPPMGRAHRARAAERASAPTQ